MLCYDGKVIGEGSSKTLSRFMENDNLRNARATTSAERKTGEQTVIRRKNVIATYKNRALLFRIKAATA